MRKKVSIVITGQPSSNPRTVKEAILLYESGYDVTVVYNYWIDWAEKEDRLLVEQYPKINWILVGGHPINNKNYYHYTRIRHKIFKSLSVYFTKSVFVQERAVTRCYPELRKQAIKSNASLYIAHNLGALPVVAAAARLNQVTYSFDAEDYHRGQFDSKDPAYCQAVLLENQYLPGAVYVSAASPLIASAYHRHYATISPVVINNVFSLKFLHSALSEYKKGDVLRVFWFSQTVGKYRGLEEMIAAMGLLKDKRIECTVLGYCSPAMKSFIFSLAEKAGVTQDQLLFKDPVTLKGIFELASQQHIGLATETESTENRQYCLTNKLFVYLMSGLATVFTTTLAQDNFLAENPGIGASFRADDINKLSGLLENWINHPEELNELRRNAIRLATQRFNWEKESILLLEQVKGAITS